MIGEEKRSGIPEKEHGGCSIQPGLGLIEEDLDEWLEETVWQGMRMWHCIFLGIGATLSVIILLCCCFKFRIPRTKQEIEGDYIRRKIMRKFRKRLKAIQNQELDEMDLKKALDKIRTELKSDTESLQQSDVLSGATLSSAGGGNPAGSTYRRASQIQIDISLEDLRIQSMGFFPRMAFALNKFFGRSKKAQDAGGASGESDEENGGAGVGDKPTTALLPAKKAPVVEKPDSKKLPVVDKTDTRKKVVEASKEEAVASTSKKPDKKQKPPAAAPATVIQEKETERDNGKKGSKPTKKPKPEVASKPVAGDKKPEVASKPVTSGKKPEVASRPTASDKKPALPSKPVTSEKNKESKK